MRIAVGGIHTECSTYSPVLMRQEDFRVFRGAELLEAEYFNFLGGSGAEVLPLLHARAVPAAPCRVWPMRRSRRSFSNV